MGKVDYAKIRRQNLLETKKKIKESVNEDNLISQAINSIEEIDKIINMLSKRLREWYSLYNPEFTKSITHNEKFVELIQKKSKQHLLKELNITYSMGSDLKKQDLDAIFNLAKKLESLFNYKNETKAYLDKVMDKYCPNLKELAGTTIAAELIEHTGSLKKLALLPASTIQILGAEKALFRHIKTGARPPKFGIIFDHQLIQQAKRPDQGKRARSLADKLILAIRADYFKGDFIAKKLKQDLEKKFPSKTKRTK
jgi:nucleolar protein 56